MEKIKKNEEYEVEIIDNGAEGEGIAKIDNFTVFVEGAIKGEKVRILIVKVLTSYAYGKLLKVIEPSAFRIEVNCDTYKRCGGCNLRHIEYEETLNIKQKNVQNLFDKTFGKESVRVEKTIGMGNPYFYRNKAQYPIGITNAGEPAIGIYAERTHEIIPMKNCQIQNPLAEQIAFCIYQFLKENKLPIYNEKLGRGIFRHIVIKTGIRTRRNDVHFSSK